VIEKHNDSFSLNAVVKKCEEKLQNVEKKIFEIGSL
jgi:hypothetical protein